MQKHIDETRQHLAKEKDGKKAILQMQDVYRANPALGDAGSLENQLKNSNEQIEKIEADLRQYEGWYTEATGGTPSRQASVASTHQQSQGRPQYSQPLKTAESAKPTLQHEETFDDFEEDGEAVGTCTAMFAFSANSEGAMSMKEGEEFTILESDKGDGWTRVSNGPADGYVPTSYLEVKFY